MALAPINLTMFRGDTPSFNFVVTTDGVATNLTSTTLRFGAKYSLTDADSTVLMSKTTGAGITVTNAAGGLATLLLAKTDTSTLPGINLVLFYDLQLTLADLSVFTLAYGTLTILSDVNQTTP